MTLKRVRTDLEQRFNCDLSVAFLKATVTRLYQQWQLARAGGGGVLIQGDEAMAQGPLHGWSLGRCTE